MKAPFGGSVTFADNITGDVLTSAVKPLQVIVYQWRLYLGRSLSIQDLAIAFFFFSSPMDIARSKTENHPILIPLIAFLP